MFVSHTIPHPVVFHPVRLQPGRANGLLIFQVLEFPKKDVPVNRRNFAKIDQYHFIYAWHRERVYKGGHSRWSWWIHKHTNTQERSQLHTYRPISVRCIRINGDCDEIVMLF